MLVSSPPPSSPDVMGQHNELRGVTSRAALVISSFSLQNDSQYVPLFPHTSPYFARVTGL